MVGLQDAILVGAELLKLSLEKLRLLVRNSLFVENENVGDVVRVNLYGQYNVAGSVTADVPCSLGRSKSDSAPS